MKKVIITVVAIFGLLLLSAIIAPFVVDLNKFKPVIKSVVEKQVNGIFDIENIELTVFSGLGAQLTGVSLAPIDNPGKTIFKVAELNAKVSIFSIFSGVSTVRIYIDQAEFRVEKNAKGELNLTKLLEKAIDLGVKETNEAKGNEYEEESAITKNFVEDQEKNVETQKASKNEAQKLQGEKSEEVVKDNSIEDNFLKMLHRVTLNLALEKTLFSYTDMTQKEPAPIEIKDFNLYLKDVKLGEEFTYEFDCMADMKDIKGNISLEGTISADLKDKKPEFKINGNLELSELQFLFPGLMEKTDKDTWTIEYYIGFSDYKLKFTQKTKMNIATLLDKPFTNELVFSTRLNASLSSDYQPVYSDLSMHFSSQGSSIGLRAKVSNLDNIEFNVKSDYFNIDDFITPPPALMTALLSSDKTKPSAESNNTAQDETKAEVNNDSNSDTAGLESGDNLDQANNDDNAKISDPFKDIRDDPQFLELKVSGDIHLSRIIAARTEIKNFIGTLNLNKLKIFSSFTFNVFQGNINVGQMILNMRTRRPLFSVDARLLGIDIEPAATSLLGLKDVAKGKFKGKIELTGAGVDANVILNTLKGELSLEGQDVKIKAINLLDSVKNSLKKVSLLEKINLAKYQFDEGFDSLKADVEMKSGEAIFRLLEFYRKQQYLLALKGKSTYEPKLNLTGDFNFIPPASTQIVPTRARSLLLNKRGELSFPFYARYEGEKLSYGVDSEKVMGSYGNRAKDRAVDEAKRVIKNKNLDKKIIEKVPEKHKDKAKKLLKKFGF